MGRQALLLVLGIAGFWGGGVLVSALLAFPAGWGVQGLWLGLNCGTSIVGKRLSSAVASMVIAPCLTSSPTAFSLVPALPVPTAQGGQAKHQNDK